jgi:hypothetical protein
MECPQAMQNLVGEASAVAVAEAEEMRGSLDSLRSLGMTAG